MRKKLPAAIYASIQTAALRTAYCACTFVFLAVCFTVTSNAQPPIVIDFERLPPQPVFTIGSVTFNGPLATDFTTWPGFAHSGTGAVQHCIGQEFCDAPLTVRFTAGQRRAKLWVGYMAQLGVGRLVVLQALDQNNALVHEVTDLIGPSAGPIPVQKPLEVNSTSANIHQLLLKFAPGPDGRSFNTGLVIDDVEFSSAGPPPPCATTEIPSVSLEEPRNILTGQPNNVQINEFTLKGTVTTAVLLDEAVLKITGPGGTRSSDLLSTNIVSRSGGNFGAISVGDSLMPGSNNVSIRVRNCAGTSEDEGVVVFTPIAEGTRLKLLGLEVNQATQTLNNGIPLVANKPTVVRVYLQVTGATSVLNGVRAAITATRPGGPTLPPLLQSMNTITVDSSSNLDSRRRTIFGSLNFELPREWLTPGKLHFEVSKLYVQGLESSLPCDGCRNLDENNWPRSVQFRPTKSLNLVLAPYVWESPQTQTPTPDYFVTPMGALQWVNSAFPLSGSFPGSNIGVNLLRTLQLRTTTRELHTDEGLSHFLDDLQDVMNSLQDQSGNDLPSDARLLGIVPVGNRGASWASSNVAFADTWAAELGPVPYEKFESYGALWAHELGHKPIVKHPGDSHGENPPNDLTAPHAHGGIGEPGVQIRTGYWNTEPPSVIDPGRPDSESFHAHDFMSYGRNTSMHTRNWVSPYTYNALFHFFEDLTQLSLAASPQRMEKLVVVGRLNAYGTAILRPFHRVTTEYATPADDKGEFTIELLDAKGKKLHTHRFDPQRSRNSRQFSISEYVPWKSGTQLIVIKRGKSVIARRKVSAHKPWVKVLTPKKGETWGQKATITWEAGDQDYDSLTYSVFYNSGLDSIWLPIANGVTGRSTTVQTNLLPGSSRARVRVRVTDGVNTTEAESDGTFVVEEKQPAVVILHPGNGQVLAPGTSPQLIGAAYDSEDGMLPITSLKWSSDRDGVLEQGECATTRPLSSGPHVITLTATDSRGNSTSSRVNITVGRDRLSVGSSPLPRK